MRNALNLHQQICNNNTDHNNKNTDALIVKALSAKQLDMTVQKVRKATSTALLLRGSIKN
jgi:hypothetical protein